VRKLADTFNNPENRESAYFYFYDNSLIIHGFPPNLPANRKVLNSSFISYGKHFLI
jgi:hypothetical protein